MITFFPESGPLRGAGARVEPDFVPDVRIVDGHQADETVNGAEDGHSPKYVVTIRRDSTTSGSVSKKAECKCDRNSE